jgi:hypothetical protein
MGCRKFANDESLGVYWRKSSERSPTVKVLLPKIVLMFIEQLFIFFVEYFMVGLIYAFAHQH